ncbi:MAG: hypothetical protein ACWGQW_15190 [bacterium]
MLLKLSDDEAEVLDDILGMWIEGAEAEVPALAQSEAEAHWSMYALRKQAAIAGRIKMRIQLERRDDGSG